MRRLVNISVLSLLVSSAATAQTIENNTTAVVEWHGEIVPDDALAATAPGVSLESVNRGDAFRDGVNILTLSNLTQAEVDVADANAAAEVTVTPGPVRVGLVRPIDPTNLAAAGIETAVETELTDGRTMWTLAISSPGAHAMRVHFTGFHVGRGQAIVYAPWDGETLIRGPYTGFGYNGDGDFWSASVPGDIAFIEIVAGPDDDVQFEVWEVLHFDRVFDAEEGLDGIAEAQGGPLGCHNDVMCHSVNTFARQATGRMNYIKNGSSFVCTGTLLNDQDSETVVPYFLTAYHCTNTQSVVNTLEVTWFWQRASCGGTLPTFANLPSNTGGTLWRTNPTSGGNDMAFIQLNGGLPGGIGLAGWTTGHPDPAYGIHHPAGSWKRYSNFETVGFCPGCEFCGDSSDYDFYDILDGAIEGGSSGSGIFNSSGQLAGQLFGHCCVIAACAGEDIACNNLDEFVYYYGEFETTHPLISRWLQIGGTMHVNSSASVLGNGTPGSPYKFVSQAHSAAWNGLRIKIQAGNYPENPTLNKQLTLIANGGTVRIGT